MSVTNTEVLIIGSGIIGSAIAYHVAREGRQVLVVERSEAACAPAASWASAGGVRQQERPQAEAKLILEAIERWSTLEQELEADLLYRRGGSLVLAETDAEAEHLVAFVQHQQEQGFTDVRLVDRQEVYTLVQGLHDGVVAGSYSPSDGQADAVRTTRAFATAAQQYGAIYWSSTSVLALLTQNERVIGAQTERGEVQAEQVVLAAGAWSDEVASSIGLHLPIRTRGLQIILSTPTPHHILLPVIGAVNRALTLKQLPDGAFLLGGGWPSDPSPDRRSCMLRPSSIRGNWETACELLPAVGHQAIAQIWCGLEAQSFDNLPFIGPMPGMDRLTVALGFSGRGFALAPAIGRAVARQLTGHLAPELDSLSPNRITNFQPDQVEAFLAIS
jgi:sarcosine oxidase, subunit beta